MHTIVLNKTEVENNRQEYRDYDILTYENGIYQKEICAKIGLDCEAYRQKIRNIYSNVNEQNIRIGNLHKGIPKPILIATVEISEVDIATTPVHICDAVDYAKACNKINNPKQNYNVTDAIQNLLNKLKSDNLVLLINDALHNHDEHEH